MASSTISRLIGLFFSVAVLVGLVLAISVPVHTENRAVAAPTVELNQLADAVVFNKDGQLLQPTGYRRWVYVGTPLTPHDMNGGKAAFPEFHNVYVHPQAFDTYERTGEFPDGTVVVKELVSVGSKQASSGRGYFMGDFIGLEVAMKDKRRFRDEPGNWAFFSFGHEYPLLETALPQPAANCSACHANLADDDFVFTQYYPVLRAAAESPKAEGN